MITMGRNYANHCKALPQHMILIQKGVWRSMQRIIMIVDNVQAAMLQLPAGDRAPSHIRQWCLEMQVYLVGHYQRVLQSETVAVASCTGEWLAAMGFAAVRCIICNLPVFGLAQTLDLSMCLLVWVLSCGCLSVLVDATASLASCTDHAKLICQAITESLQCLQTWTAAWHK